MGFFSNSSSLLLIFSLTHFWPLPSFFFSADGGESTGAAAWLVGVAEGGLGLGFLAAKLEGEDARQAATLGTAKAVNSSFGRGQRGGAAW
jgi:hypothetical protein